MLKSIAVSLSFLSLILLNTNCGTKSSKKSPPVTQGPNQINPNGTDKSAEEKAAADKAAADKAAAEKAKPGLTTAVQELSKTYCTVKLANDVPDASDQIILKKDSTYLLAADSPLSVYYVASDSDSKLVKVNIKSTDIGLGSCDLDNIESNYAAFNTYDLFASSDFTKPKVCTIKAGTIFKGEYSLTSIGQTNSLRSSNFSEICAGFAFALTNQTVINGEVYFPRTSITPGLPTWPTPTPVFPLPVTPAPEKKCRGYADFCSSQSSSFSCGSLSGCYWSYSSNKCNGVADSCFLKRTEFSCENQSGCRWE